MKLKEIEMALDLWDSFDDEDDSNDFNLGQVKEVSGSTEAAYAENKLSTEPLLLLSAQEIKNQHEQEARTRLLERDDLYHGTIDIGSDRINPEDKLIFGATSDINQVVPIRLNWAREAWYNGCNNNWMPQEVDMKDDIAQWKHESFLTNRERLCITNSLGFFSTADSIVANNLVLAIYKHITNAECRNFLLRQAFEESMHTEAYVYCAESLGLDQALTFNQYRENHSMIQKDNWCLEYTDGLLADVGDVSPEQLIANLIAFYAIMEGMFFYCGFANVLSMGRRGRMPGVAEQFQLIMRDEGQHVNFGMSMVRQMFVDVPNINKPRVLKKSLEIIMEGTYLEKVFATDVMGDGVQGMNPRIMHQYLEFIADRRLMDIGLEAQFKVQNPMQWMSEQMDFRKEGNFFEVRVTEYQVGGLKFN